MIPDVLRTSFEPSHPASPGEGEGITAQVASGPQTQLAGTSRHGSSGLRAMRVRWDGPGERRIVIVDTPVRVPADGRLSYDLFLDADLDDPTPPGAFVCLDLVFDDGATLSASSPVDAHGVGLSPTAQGDARILMPLQWNRVSCALDGFEGRTVTQVVAWVDSPDAGQAWIDDVAIDAAPRGVDPVDLVDTRRGSNSSFELSRGNTYPATGLPNGALLTSPSTRRALDWFYSWSRHNTSCGYPAFEGVVLTNQPSPWMGDRNQLILTPTWADSCEPHTFSHANEEARPYRYRVQLDGGPRVELAPTGHGCVLRLGLPDTDGTLRLGVGVCSGDFRLRQRDDGLWVGWVDNGSGLSVGRSRLYVAIAFDAPSSLDNAKPLRIRLDAQPGESVEARIGTSLLGSAQAVAVLRDELDADFTELADAARGQWAERLGVLDLEGATHDQRVSAYSSLYRVGIFPNFSDEVVDGSTVHASPVLPHLRDSDDDTTGAQVVPGRMAVNHGFWDTYRTVWPLYALAYPEEGAALADGFVEQYRSGGWVARWSSPGYADLMTGTSSDVAFADLDAKGAPLPDRRATYLAGLRNATSMPTSPGVGRKDLWFVFRGAPTPESHEPVSWAFEASLNDHALGLMAARLADDPALDERAARRLRDESAYLLGRASTYANLFDSSTGFFQSRRLDGTFRTPSADYDPCVWGGDYTEANGWSYAFPAPHDVAGLAHLVGGREGLRRRLDEFFATPERGNLPGTYPAGMHEITEARLTRAGQFAVSNQPVHHIPFLYAFTSTPWRVGEIVRDAVRRLFRGSEIGQGYPGDEDNGEMSAWYLFAIAGLYPLQVGTSRYTLHAPSVPVNRWHLPGGDLVIRAEGEGDYVQSVSLDGAPVGRTWIDHSELLGGRELVFQLGDEPSSWGVEQDASAESLTPWGEAPSRWVDVGPEGSLSRTAEGASSTSGVGGAASTNGADVSVLVDDEPRGEARVAAGEALEWRFDAPTRVEAYTLTGGADAVDGLAWRLEAFDGTVWSVVDERDGESFEWPAQLRPFVLNAPVEAEALRLVFETEVTLAQVELLALRPVTAG